MGDEDRKCPLSIISPTQIIQCIHTECQLWLPEEPISKVGGTELTLPEGCALKRQMRQSQFTLC